MAYKIWDNGKKVTVIKDFGICDDEDIVRMSLFESDWHLATPFLKNYNIAINASNEVFDIDEIKSKFKVVLRVFAYIHSGIALSTSPFGDVFDSGLAGYCWSNELTEEELTAQVKLYSDYMNGLIHEYKTTTYAKNGSKWEKYDECWQYDYYKEGDELWEIIDFEIKDELTEFPKSLIMEVQNREVKPNDVLDYLDSLDY